MDYIKHHGILGQKWGVRRFQNEDGSLTKAGKKRYMKEMEKDMESHFRSQISKEANKVTNIGRNGYPIQGMSWHDAYGKKVFANDAQEVRSAAYQTRKYMYEKYGKKTMQAFASSGELFRPISDFNPSDTKAGKELLDKILNE